MMNVSCGRCETTYRVDPAKVPATGIRAKCTRCGSLIEVPAAERAGVLDTGGGAPVERPVLEPATTPQRAAAGVHQQTRTGEAGAATRESPARSTAPAAHESASPQSPSPAPQAPAAAPSRAPASTEAAEAGSAAGAAAATEPNTSKRPTPMFGSSDPDAKARRLARALISDIVVYHPERREKSIAAGTLRDEFREEIQKSWEEYTGQVGDRMARSTPHFRDALNEILAGGRRMF